MSRGRQIHTNFSAGVISPEAEARIDSPTYDSGLSEGKNVIIKTTGGVARRPGTLFVRDYGKLAHMRIFPFIFNTDQKYVIVIYLDEPDPVGSPGVYDGLIDIYRDNVLVLPGIVTPYNTEKKIREIDIAQSADTMVFAQGDHEPQVLRRLGADDDWEMVDMPIVNPPCEAMLCEDDTTPGSFVPPTCADGSTPYCGSGECADGVAPTCPIDHTLVTTLQWTYDNGWPKHVTFHQGRLWFAGTNKYPQSVWSSKSQDFFNFDVGIGDPADSIQETLDTDYVNPITSIYSAGRLMVFTSGAEFYNKSTLLTPTTSSWFRQTTYGSSRTVRPQSVDGTVIFLDNTERTFRQFTFSDTIDGYDSPSISSESENLINLPVAMGAMRGGVSEPSNFIYVVNADGTMAVLNTSKAYRINAWTSWNTQGFFQDVMDLDRELYILVKRYVDVAGVLELHWMLELSSVTALTDSASINESLSETTVTSVGKDASNFFGIYQEPGSNDAKVVIVVDDVVVYQTEFLKNNPLESYRNPEDVVYSAGNVFSTSESVRSEYFDPEVGYRWYMHTVTSLQLVDYAHNYVDGLTHLINQSVVGVLDGNVFMDELVVPGDTENTVENTYPDGIDWLYDETVGNESKILRHTSDGVTVGVEAWYNGVHYTDLVGSQHGYLIAGVDGEPGAEYLQEGTNVENITQPSTFEFSTDGVFNIPVGISILTFELLGAGGSAGGGAGGEGNADGNGGAGGKGGGASPLQTNIFPVTYPQSVSFTMGIPSASRGAGGQGADSCSSSNGPGLIGYSGTESTLTLPDATVITAEGGVAGAGAGTTVCNGCECGTVGESTLHGAGGVRGCGGVVGGNAVGFGSGGGGGGGGHGDSCGDAQNGGAGGLGAPGVVIFTTDKVLVDFSHRTRKMVLVAVAITDGIVVFPEDPYVVGEVGLLFDVKVTSLPINVSAGGGSLINEPKRLVAITAKMVDTQGIDINGVSMPEREFGEEVFDRAVPLITGISKIRLLGYNRDTRVYISQDVPMHMTLLSLDIEVNY